MFGFELFVVGLACGQLDAQLLDFVVGIFEGGEALLERGYLDFERLDLVDFGLKLVSFFCLFVSFFKIVCLFKDS